MHASSRLLLVTTAVLSGFVSCQKPPPTLSEPPAAHDIAARCFGLPISEHLDFAAVTSELEHELATSDDDCSAVVAASLLQSAWRTGRLGHAQGDRGDLGVAATITAHAINRCEQIPTADRQRMWRESLGNPGGATCGMYCDSLTAAWREYQRLVEQGVLREVGDSYIQERERPQSAFPEKFKALVGSTQE